MNSIFDISSCISYITSTPASRIYNFPLTFSGNDNLHTHENNLTGQNVLISYFSLEYPLNLEHTHVLTSSTTISTSNQRDGKLEQQLVLRRGAQTNDVVVESDLCQVLESGLVPTIILQEWQVTVRLKWASSLQTTDTQQCPTLEGGAPTLHQVSNVLALSFIFLLVFLKNSA